jgi:DinB superfamily
MLLDAMLIQTVEAAALAVRVISDTALERDWPWRGVEADLRWACYRTYEELRDLAVTVAAERTAVGTPPTAAQRTMAQYQVAYRDLKGLLLDPTGADVDRVPVEGEWSLRNLLAHMLQVERRHLGVATYALSRHRTGDSGPAQAPDAWFEQYESEPADAGTLAAILAHYDRVHQRVLHELAPLSDADLSIPVAWWYDADLRFVCGRFDSHLRQHTIQAEKLLEVIRPRPGDGQRTARLIYQALGEAEGAAIGTPGIAAERCLELAHAIEERFAELATIAAS